MLQMLIKVFFQGSIVFIPIKLQVYDKDAIGVAAKDSVKKLQDMTYTWGRVENGPTET